MTRFYLGTHRGRWLEDHAFQGTPLFVTYNTLSAYQRRGDEFPKGVVTGYAQDSGGFPACLDWGDPTWLRNEDLFLLRYWQRLIRTRRNPRSSADAGRSAGG